MDWGAPPLDPRADGRMALSSQPSWKVLHHRSCLDSPPGGMNQTTDRQRGSTRKKHEWGGAPAAERKRRPSRWVSVYILHNTPGQRFSPTRRRKKHHHHQNMCTIESQTLPPRKKSSQIIVTNSTTRKLLLLDLCGKEFGMEKETVCYIRSIKWRNICNWMTMHREGRERPFVCTLPM